MSDFEPSQSRSKLSPDWDPGTRLVVGVLMILLAAILLYQVRQLLIPIVLALLLAYVLHPVVVRFQNRTGAQRWVAVGLIFLLIVLALIGATTGIGIAAAQRVAGFGEFLEGASEGVPDLVEGLMDLRLNIGPWTIDLEDANLAPFTDAIASALTPLLSQTGILLSGLAGATASAVGNTLLVLVVSFYLLLDFERFGEALLSLVPEAHQSDALAIMRDVGAIWHAFLRGQLILGLAVGAATAVIMAVLGVRFALGLGLIAGVLEFVPIFGPWITGLISVLVALFQGVNPWGLTPLGFALLVMGASFLIQQVENNILYPRIIGHSLDLNPLVVLLALLAAGSIAGIFGLLLAAPAAATLRLCFGYLYWKTVGVQPPPRKVLTERRPSIFRVFLERLRKRRRRKETTEPE